MKSIKDISEYLEKVAKLYNVPLADVVSAMNSLDMVKRCAGIHLLDNDHPEPLEGTLGWLHTPKGACNICPTKEGYRMINGLRFLEGKEPITQMGKLDMDRD